MSAPRGRDRGFALVLVLWVLVVLAGIAGRQAALVRSDAVDLRAAEAAARLRHAADAGIAAAVARIRLARAAGKVPAGFACRFGEAVLTVRIEDEEGKLDVNAVGAPVLAALFAGLGVAPEAAALLAGSIADFRDADGLSRAPGAELAAYRTLGLPAGPRDGALEARAELWAVPGSAALLPLDPWRFLTVHSGRNSLDETLAAPEVLEAVRSLGTDPAEVFAPSSRTTFRLVAEARAGPARAGREAVVRLDRAGRLAVLEWVAAPPFPAAAAETADTC